MKKNKYKYINREISWLSFNERVLQEAADSTMPLIERIKFLGIFSSNLDEFYRVRVATLTRMVNTRKKVKLVFGEDPGEVLDEIQQIVINQLDKFDKIYGDILEKLAQKRIYIINENQLSPDQETFIKDYFHRVVRPSLFPIMIDENSQFPELKDHSIYLAVRMLRENVPKSVKYSIIEIPSNTIPRFLVLPKKFNNTYIILLDDVIRAGLRDIFAIFNFNILEAFTIKMTRDAELDIDSDITTSLFEKMTKSLKQRKKGAPVRFVYDSTMPKDILKLLSKKIHTFFTDTKIPGGKYHNFKDFMEFPAIGHKNLRYKALPPLQNVDIHQDKSLFTTLRKRDLMLVYPYHSFNSFIDLMREASIDPKVSSIRITLYRVAKNSTVVNALINAIRNGKSVTVILELKARFDEEANIYWTTRLREEGAKIIHGVPDLKVHCKLCLITRNEKSGIVRYATVGTGNFNESTAPVYSDHNLFTADKRITGEVKKIFDFFEHNYNMSTFRHLLVAPFSMRKRLTEMTKNEIANARAGKEAYIILKVNSLVDKELIDWLYKASNAGVTVKLIARGICSLIPGVEGMSANISAISIVDRFLEHSRIFVFCNGGEEKFYISSADWMTRNLDRRVEVACPIYDKELQSELRDYLTIQFSDNTKARFIDVNRENRYKQEPGKPRVNTQFDFYNYLKNKASSTIV